MLVGILLRPIRDALVMPVLCGVPAGVLLVHGGVLPRAPFGPLRETSGFVNASTVVYVSFIKNALNFHRAHGLAEGGIRRAGQPRLGGISGIPFESRPVAKKSPLLVQKLRKSADFRARGRKKRRRRKGDFEKSQVEALRGAKALRQLVENARKNTDFRNFCPSGREKVASGPRWVLDLACEGRPEGRQRRCRRFLRKRFR